MPLTGLTDLRSLGGARCVVDQDLQLASTASSW